MTMHCVTFLGDVKQIKAKSIITGKSPTGQLLAFCEGSLCESPSLCDVTVVTASLPPPTPPPPVQLNHLLTYISGPRPLLRVYSPNPFPQQMTGSPSEPVRCSRLRCVTVRAHPIMHSERRRPIWWRRGSARNRSFGGTPLTSLAALGPATAVTSQGGTGVGGA